MTRLIVPVIIALVVSGPAWGNELIGACSGRLEWIHSGQGIVNQWLRESLKFAPFLCHGALVFILLSLIL